ncbi:MAG: hypothetical protein KGS09_06120, partial [Nitrospirae bacterium]|nr:hypothetical protein [Nitrospirota bacterium]
QNLCMNPNYLRAWANSVADKLRLSMTGMLKWHSSTGWFDLLVSKSSQNHMAKDWRMNVFYLPIGWFKIN